MNRLFRLSLFIALLPLLASCSGSKTCDVRALVTSPEPGTAAEIMLPMRDCVRLATDVYLPPGNGPFPAILIRLPYGKSGAGLSGAVGGLMASMFRNEGYATIVQDTRGRFRSEGEWFPLKYESQDGIDTVRWVENQPWFNGSLGMAGASYFGFTQLAVSWQRPSSLKAIAPLITPGDAYDLLFHRGLPRADLTVYWGLMMREQDQEALVPESTFLAAATHWPLIEGDDANGGNIPWLDEWLRHPLDDGYYDQYIPENGIELADVPMFMVSGWFDAFEETQLDDFARAQARPGAGGKDRIVVGPWTHSLGVGENHDLEFPHGSNFPASFRLLMDWFAVYLKGAAAPASWGPVRIYDPGKDAWLDRPALWSNGRTAFRLYLDGTQAAAACGTPGLLDDTPPASAATIGYTYDPLNPIINTGGGVLVLSRAGCREQADLCGRGDVVSFESDPFAEPVTWEGKAVLTLPVSSSAPDTAFIARISLLRGGNAYSLREGVMTLSHREGDASLADYTPGEVVTLKIEFPPLLWSLQAGEALRLEIMSSSLPAVVQHPNVDRDWFLTAAPLPAEQTLHLSPDNPAFLEIPASQ